jgi:hypothetical protein
MSRVVSTGVGKVGCGFIVAVVDWYRTVVSILGEIWPIIPFNEVFKLIPQC